MIETENKATIRRWIEVWSTGNLAELDALIAPRYTFHRFGNASPAEPGPAYYKQLVTTVRTVRPDFHATIDDLVAEGNKVVTRWTATGTHEGPYTTPWGAIVPPTHRTITYSGITIHRLEDGKIAEEWWATDLVSFLQQIGAIPSESK